MKRRRLEWRRQKVAPRLLVKALAALAELMLRGVCERQIKWRGVQGGGVASARLRLRQRQRRGQQVELRRLVASEPAQAAAAIRGRQAGGWQAVPTLLHASMSIDTGM